MIKGCFLVGRSAKVRNKNFLDRDLNMNIIFNLHDHSRLHIIGCICLQKQKPSGCILSRSVSVLWCLAPSPTSKETYRLGPFFVEFACCPCACVASLQVFWLKPCCEDSDLGLCWPSDGGYPASCSMVPGIRSNPHAWKTNEYWV